MTAFFTIALHDGSLWVLLACVVVVKLKRERYLWVPAVPACWLVICTLTAGWQKLFDPSPKLGFPAAAKKFADAINEGNVKGLRLAYAVALGNSAGKEYNEATALAEDGFLYITDSWGVLYKIDVTSGDAGRIVWRMDPKQERQSANRGAAFWGNLVITPANAPARIIATDKNTGKIVWETNLSQDLAQLQITGAVLPIKDKIIVGASGGDRGIRDWIAAKTKEVGELARTYVPDGRLSNSSSSRARRYLARILISASTCS